MIGVQSPVFLMKSTCSVEQLMAGHCEGRILLIPLIDQFIKMNGLVKMDCKNIVLLYSNPIIG